MILKKHIKSSNCPEGYVNVNGKCIPAMNTPKKYQGEIVEVEQNNKIFRKRNKLSKKVDDFGIGTTTPINSYGIDLRNQKYVTKNQQIYIEKNYYYNVKNKKWLDLLLKKIKYDFSKSVHLNNMIYMLESLINYNYKVTQDINIWVLNNNNFMKSECLNGGIGIDNSFCLDFDINNNGLLNLKMETWS